MADRLCESNSCCGMGEVQSVTAGPYGDCMEGYSLLIATSSAQQDTKKLRAQDFKPLLSFVNQKTGRRITLWAKGDFKLATNLPNKRNPRKRS